MLLRITEIAASNDTIEDLTWWKMLYQVIITFEEYKQQFILYLNIQYAT